LDITIHGGPFGGSAEIDFDDKGKLEYLMQEAIPRSVSVAAEQTLELSFPFIAKEESASENDIKASLKFTANENLELIEIPRVATNAVGYYAQESKTHLLDHGRHGAGNWVEVAISNLCFDTVQMGINDPPWLSGGSFTWPIPNAWRVSECEEMLNQFINTDQTFILEPNGDSRVRKFGFIGEKKISGELTIRRE
jgi:hypothetical protein